MKNLFKIFTFVFVLSFIVGMNLSAQDQPTSIGPAPINNSIDRVPFIQQPVTFPDLLAGPGYAGKHIPAPINLVSIPVPAGTPFTPVGAPYTTLLQGGDFGAGGIYYATRSPSTLITINTTTGVQTVLGAITGVTGGYTITAMGYHPGSNTMYLGATNLTISQLYTLNTTTRVATLKGTITGCKGLIAIGVNCAGEIYGVDIVNDNAYKINPTTGAGTLLGPLGFNANYAQDADFEFASNILYLAAYGPTGAWRTMNLATGMTTLVVTWTGTEVTALGIVGDCAPPSGVFFDDFESYTVGQRLACQDSINWTTWSISPCNTTEDPLISNAQAFSPTKSVVIVQNNDLVKPLGNDTTGIHLMSFKFYIPTGKSGYFNTLAGFTPNPFKWGMECYFDVAATGNNGRLKAASLTVPFAYTHGSWQSVMVVVNLDIDSARFYINESYIHTWRWTAGASGTVPKVLAANNFFGATANDQMYMDDYYYNPDTSWLTGVTQNGNTVPTEYALSQNYPNPFNPSTKINFAIPTTGLVTMKIYDVLGKEVATLINEVKNPGNYIVEFDGSSLSSGVYFYKLQVGDFSSVKRMVLVK